MLLIFSNSFLVTGETAKARGHYTTPSGLKREIFVGQLPPTCYTSAMDFTPPQGTPDGPANSYDFKAILLVDDDRQLAVTLQWILADQNYMVDVAYDGEEALLKVKANEYDAIICDVMMPRLRGDEFYQQAVALRPSLADRFVFITGFGADAQINLFLCKTGSKYLMKPFPVQTLIDCVKQLLA